MSASIPDETPPSPRADLADALGWMALGAAVLIGSLAMDRLQSQGINPYTVPGLLPGLLGLAMLLLGGLLALRSLARRRAQAAPPPPTTLALADAREQWQRIAIVTALCVVYGVVLVGHGLPFWLASALYLIASMLILQRIGRSPARPRLTPGAWAQALAIGLGAGLATHLVFQELFLVRLP